MNSFYVSQKFSRVKQLSQIGVASEGVELRSSDRAPKTGLATSFPFLTMIHIIFGASVRWNSCQILCCRCPIIQHSSDTVCPLHLTLNPSLASPYTIPPTSMFSTLKQSTACCSCSTGTYPPTQTYWSWGVDKATVQLSLLML
jgi:hypothetical protein